jgi:hypothetical protein
MKKLFFSAVALIAFSSVSMANTIDIEESNKNLKSYSWRFPQELIDKINECGKAYQEIKAAYSTHPNQEQVENIAIGAFIGCMQ